MVEQSTAAYRNSVSRAIYEWQTTITMSNGASCKTSSHGFYQSFKMDTRYIFTSSPSPFISSPILLQLPSVVQSILVEKMIVKLLDKGAIQRVGLDTPGV